MTPLSNLFTPARGRVAALLSSLLLLAACGGGGGDGDSATTSDSGGTATAFTQGTITGFGSVIVNGVPVWRDGAPTGERPGRVLRRQAPRTGAGAGAGAGVVGGAGAGPGAGPGDGQGAGPASDLAH